MSYIKTTWTERIGTYLNRYTKSNETDESIQLTPDPGTISQEGTPFSTTAMQNIEDGIEENNILVTPPTKAGCQLDIGGSGLQKFPDDPDGADYISDFSSSVDDWYATNATLSFVNNKLLITPTSTDSQIYYDISLSGGEIIVFKLSIGSDFERLLIFESAAFYELTSSVVSLGGGLYYVRVPSTYTAVTKIRIDPTSTSDACELIQLYIGDGSNITGAQDHSGIHNPATNTAVLPFDSKWGKLAYYNGETSKLEFSDPVIGDVGTIRGIITSSTAGYSLRFLDTRGTGSEGLTIAKSTADKLTFFSYTEDGSQSIISTSSVDTEFMFHLVMTSSEVLFYIDGVLDTETDITSPFVVGVDNLIAGLDFNYTNGNPFAGSFYYTTEEWTADEVLSDYNNQTHQNNEPVSETALSYSLVRRGADGEGTFNGIESTGIVNTNGELIDSEGGDIQSGGGDINTENGDFNNGTGHFIPCSSPTEGTISLTTTSYILPIGVYICTLNLLGDETNTFAVWLEVYVEGSSSWKEVEFLNSEVSTSEETGAPVVMVSDGTNVRARLDGTVGASGASRLYYTKS